ncbi:hypothetical protein ACHAWC_003598 [Mediolabrus comicus]
MYTKPPSTSRHPNISHHDNTPKVFCRVIGLQSEEGRKKNGSVGYANISKRFGSGEDRRHPVCLDGFQSPMSVKASNIELYSEEHELNSTMVAIGRKTFSDTKYVAVLFYHQGGELVKKDQTPVMTGTCARSTGTLDAVELFVKNHKHNAGPAGPIILKLPDLNLAVAFNKAAKGDNVKLAHGALNKKFQRIIRMFPKEQGEQKVMVKYDPHRCWPDKFWTGMEKLGTQRYVAAKLGTYQIYPSSHVENLDALEVLYSDGSGKEDGNVVIEHELYLDYGSEETTSYAKHAVAMKETHRIYPEVLAGVDPHAFWAAILWIGPFIETLEKLQLPNGLLDEWRSIRNGRKKSQKHFKHCRGYYQFDSALLKGPDENWGITSSLNHVTVATDFSVCSYEAVQKSLRSLTTSFVITRTRGQFKGTEIWRYIRGTLLFRQERELQEKRNGKKLTTLESDLLYLTCMKSLGFNEDSKFWKRSTSTHAFQ